MKFNNKIILPMAFAGLLLVGCEDEKMEWGMPDGHSPITSMAELPLSVKEAIANYKGIKEYAAQYAPGMVVGIGMGASQYVDNMPFADGITYRGLVDENFQMYTLGNAMKHDAIVTSSGALNFSTLDSIRKYVPADMKLYGHNFIWHTQQNQNYLKGLIAPKLVVETDSDIESILGGDAANFDGGTSGGWGSWGDNKASGEVLADVGVDGTPCLVLTTKETDGDHWKGQNAFTFDSFLETEVEYTIRFKAKSNLASGALQFQYQNGKTYGCQGGYSDLAVGTDWTTCETSFTIPATDSNGNAMEVDRIIINFGKIGGATYYIDNIEFGKKKEVQPDPMINVVTGDSHDFEGGTIGTWSGWGGESTRSISEKGEGYNSDYSMKLVCPTAGGAGSDYTAQALFNMPSEMVPGKTYVYSFMAKCDIAAGTVQRCWQDASGSPQGGWSNHAVGTDWVPIEGEFVIPEGTEAKDGLTRFFINFGAEAATYWIDNFKIGEKNPDYNSDANKSLKASKMYYVMKTPAEKREALLGSMESWIKGMADYLSTNNIVPYGYDVINEAIADGSNSPRGFNGIFGGTWDNDGVTEYDAEPTETETEGLSLNWGGGHFYWGYYVEDYAVKAFQYARQYLPAETKLFYNDYNLETSPGKRKAVIDFVKSIDDANGAPIVDGIGTQCHLRLDVAADEPFAEQIEKFMAQVEASLTELVSTGKLVRITELDISLGTASPAANQLEAQYEAYRRVFEAYRRIVPEAQQSGITIWTVTDHADEHVYWLPDESPNLFDKDGKRKWSFKGVCDGLAGEDLGLQFGGDDYKAWYELKNTGDF